MQTNQETDTPIDLSNHLSPIIGQFLNSGMSAIQRIRQIQAQAEALTERQTKERVQLVEASK